MRLLGMEVVAAFRSFKVGFESDGGSRNTTVDGGAIGGCAAIIHGFDNDNDNDDDNGG